MLIIFVSLLAFPLKEPLVSVGSGPEFRPKNVPMVEVVCNGMPVNMELMRHLVSEPTSARAAAHVVARGLRDRQ